MILGMSIAAFTTLHTALSLVGIASGLVVAAGLTSGRDYPALTAVFLVTTILTSVTGFLFPASTLLPSHIFGIVSLIVLALAVYALYGRALSGVWRNVYVAGALFALYLNAFVGIVQAFQKLTPLQRLAPTQSEAPFVIAQVLALGAFLAIGAKAMRTRSPPRPAPYA